MLMRLTFNSSSFVIEVETAADDSVFTETVKMYFLNSMSKFVGKTAQIIRKTGGCRFEAFQKRTHNINETITQSREANPNKAATLGLLNDRISRKKRLFIYQFAILCKKIDTSSKC